MRPTAFVTGVAGQDGVLLARHLLAEGYLVVGTRRPGAAPRFEPYLDGVTVIEHDLVDTAGFAEILATFRPAEVYNLAGFTQVGRSWDEPAVVHEVNTAAVERMLDVLLATPDAPRYFQASSSEVFGPEAANPQNEESPHRPANPYAESKSAAQKLTASARDAGLFACVGTLYNHESVLRGPEFVTRKITRGAVDIAAGRQDVLELGNLEVSRDWGAAADFVVAMHAALRHDEPGDYIIATGVSHTLRDLVEAAFAAAGVTDPWDRVRQDPDLLRRADTPGLVGDPTRARDVLGWTSSVSFAELVADMVAADEQRLATGVEESPDYLVSRPR
jgi:GDPmannose 4,6-dehydratase